MARPRYETQSDVLNEMDTISRFCASERFVGCGYRAHKLPMSYGFDFALTDSSNRLKAIAEVKNRNCAMNDYATLMMFVSKMITGLSYVDYFHRASKGDVAVLFIVQWTDHLGYYRLRASDKFEHKLWGRTDRGDRLDKQPTAFIPIDCFEVIE